MSDEQTIYISPDDDLTTVRGRLEGIPSRKIILVIPNQTQLRSHVAWKLLYARLRELGKEVLIVSSDPQVRSVAHAVKFRVAHSLESVPGSNPGRSKSGSRAGIGRSNVGTGRSRPTQPSTTTRATTAKEPAAGRGSSRLSRPSHTTRSPLAGPVEQASTWSEPVPFNPFAQPEHGDIQPSHFNDPDAVQPDEIPPHFFDAPERSQQYDYDERKSHYNQSYDFHVETPPSIHPLSIDSVEEPDLLIEDYEQAQDIRQAASGSLPAVNKPASDDPGNAASGKSDLPISHVEVNPSKASQPSRSQTYGEDDPFIYMQDDSQTPPRQEQQGEATLEEDEISHEHPSLQKPANRTNVAGNFAPTPNLLEHHIEDHNDDDEDDSIPPISPTPIMQARSRSEQRPISRSAPEPIPLPMPRAQSQPLAPASRTSRPLSGRPSGKIAGQNASAAPPASTPPTQKPITVPTARGGSQASRTPQSPQSRPVSRPIPQRVDATRPKSLTPWGKQQITRTRANRASRSRNRRLYFILALVAIICISVFAVVYLNISSTVKLTITTQSYTHAVTLTLSHTGQANTVPAAPQTLTFTKTGSEPATGTKMQATNYATGTVNFTNSGTTSIQIPSQTIIATTDNTDFVTTANVLVTPQSANTVSLPVPIQASNSGVGGNVDAGTITVIPDASLTSIAQAQTSPVTVASLKSTLTVSNPDATQGGDAKAVPAITQQDLNNAQKDLYQQTLVDINTRMQQIAKGGKLVGQPVTTDTLISPPPVGQVEPNKTFSASIKVVATILVAQQADAQKIAANLLNNAVHADKQFGPAFAIIGDTQLAQTQQNSGNSNTGNTITINATGQVGPNLNVQALQNSITGKSFSQAQTIIRQQNQHIQTVNIQTQPSIFNWVSPWANHIHLVMQPTTKP